MKRLWSGRSLFVLASLAISTLIVYANSGVREIRRGSTTDSSDVALTDATPSSTDWPWWRGANQSNRAVNAFVPFQWSESDNIRWKAAIPGRGHSSPCIWGDRIFLTTAHDESQTISLFSLDRESGELVWQKELHQGGFGECHKKNSYASATPVCDGTYVYVASNVKGTIWVTAVGFAGQIAWSREAGPYAAEWGYGSSPTIHKSLVIVSADHRGSGVDRIVGSSWMAGLHRSTGEIIWRIKRQEGDSFGTPIVARIAGKDQLLLAGKDFVTSCDPDTGVVIWKCRWSAKRTANTIAYDDRCVYASTRQPGPEIICIRADGEGDVTETHVVWSERKSAADVPSPCVANDHLFVIGDDGILTCLNATDGKQVWKKRLGGNVSSSPLVVGNHLLCCNEDGVTFVVDLEGRGEVIRENSLNDGILATPVIVGHHIYLRTSKSLFCLGGNRSVPLANKELESPPRL